MNSPTGQTSRQIFTLDGSNDADLCKDVPLGVSLTLLPILGVKCPKNPNFGGVNRRFQAKQTKYWKFHVIETTALISTKFCMIETIKWSSLMVPIGAQQIQDGGRPPFWKKNVKSPYLLQPFDQFLWDLGQWTHTLWVKKNRTPYYCS